MSYHYGGLMSKKKKERYLKAIIVFTLMLSIFAEMSPILAHHHYHYRDPDGTVVHHKHHWRARHGDYDDFHYYSTWVNSTIPVKDLKVRDILKDGSELSKILQTVTKTSEERTIVQNQGRQLDYLNVIAMGLMDKNYFKGILNKLKNPMTFTGIIDEKMKNVNTFANPEIGVFGGLKTGYSKKDMEDGVYGKIMKDKIEYVKKANLDAAKVQDEILKKKLELDKDIKKIGEGNNDGLTSGSSEVGDKGESTIAQLEKKNALIKQKMAYEDLDAKSAGISSRGYQEMEALDNARVAIHNSHARDKMRHANSKEIKALMSEKLKKSESRDLGFIQFGSGKKANFGKILSDVIEPPTDENGNLKTNPGPKTDSKSTRNKDLDKILDSVIVH